MGDIELFFIAIGASMDAFAVALCQGLAMKNMKMSHGLLIGFMFGFFQAFMPIIGYLLASSFSYYIQSFDHFIAFGLLTFLGARMIIETRCGTQKCEYLSFKRLLILSVATSIDALAIGITFAFLQVDVIKSSAVIGMVTFCLSFIATRVGKYLGEKMHAISQYVGGSILILIGLKILLEHLNVISF